MLLWTSVVGLFRRWVIELSTCIINGSTLKALRERRKVSSEYLC